MKNFRTILTAVALFFGAMTMSAQRMSYEAISNNARFLTDRMAYELGVRSMSIIDDLYRINFDYIYGVNEYLDEIALGYYYDDYMDICTRRDYALRRLLGDIMWNRLIGYDYFYRPIVFSNRRWHFGIYDYDRWGTHHYFYNPPRHYHNHYAGGHYFSGMRPAGGHVISGHGNHGYGAPVPDRHGADMHNGRPQGGVHNDRPQGGMNNGHNQGGVHNDRPQGGMNNGHNQGGVHNDRPQGGMNNGHNQGGMNNGHNQGGMGNDRPQGGMNQGGMGNDRPQGGMGYDRPSARTQSSSSAPARSNGFNAGRNESSSRASSRSSMNSSSSSRSNVAPVRSGATRGGESSHGGASSSSRGGGNNGGGVRGGRR